MWCFLISCTWRLWLKSQRHLSLLFRSYCRESFVLFVLVLFLWPLTLPTSGDRIWIVRVESYHHTTSSFLCAIQDVPRSNYKNLEQCLRHCSTFLLLLVGSCLESFLRPLNWARPKASRLFFDDRRARLLLSPAPCCTVLSWHKSA